MDFWPSPELHQSIFNSSYYKIWLNLKSEPAFALVMENILGPSYEQQCLDGRVVYGASLTKSCLCGGMRFGPRDATSYPGYSHEGYPSTGARFLGRIFKLFWARIFFSLSLSPSFRRIAFVFRHTSEAVYNHGGNYQIHVYVNLLCILQWKKRILAICTQDKKNEIFLNV